jgi:signal peptidase II
MVTKLRTALIALVPVVFLLDWCTKRWIEANVSFWDNHVVIPGLFSIVHAQNRGAAFSLFADSSEEIRAIVLIGMSSVVMLIVARMFWKALQFPAMHSLYGMAALALVLGGAFGNMADRVLRGSVTDFLLIYWRDWQWPAFNVADSAISTGAVLLLIDLWRRKETA